MANASHLQMHREHANWHLEDDLWREELAAWERETGEAVQNVCRLVMLLRKHGQKLRRHAAAIRIYEQDFAAHELALADVERGTAEAKSPPTAVCHQEESAHQESLRHAHDRYKLQHYNLMKVVRPLILKLESEAIHSRGGS